MALSGSRVGVGGCLRENSSTAVLGSQDRGHPRHHAQECPFGSKAAIARYLYGSSKREALNVFDLFLALFEAKYPKACASLKKDKEQLLSFYDFP